LDPLRFQLHRLARLGLNEHIGSTDECKAVISAPAGLHDGGLAEVIVVSAGRTARTVDGRLLDLRALHFLKSLGGAGHQQHHQDNDRGNEKRKYECPGKAHAPLAAANPDENAENNV
jgi:hypothetical protein